VEESIKVMNDFDTNDDQQLDRNEFALFVARFSNVLDADMHEMVDFMIVTSAMKENSETEKKYIRSIREYDIYRWGE
jgi:Ca2+-binding EF-hand superfamily protein